MPHHAAAAREIPQRPRDHAGAGLAALRGIRPLGLRGRDRAGGGGSGDNQDGSEHRVSAGDVREDRTEEVSE